MPKRVLTMLGYWGLMGMVAAWAQQSHKAGLWLVVTTTHIQQEDEAPGHFEQRGKDEKPSAERGVPVCLTREMIDYYGVILPPSLKSCEMYNVEQTANSFKGNMSCKGSYNGVGEVESQWTDENHVSGRIRFVSKTGTSQDADIMAWTQDVTAVFKSSDCGAVKPRPMPAR